MKKRIVKIIVKVVAFMTIFFTLLSSTTLVLTYGMDEMSYHPLRGFYEEPDNSLDAVYIGSSNCLTYWNPLYAWNEYGISVYSFASNAQPLATAEFMIREARRSQPNAKFLVNINTLSEVDDPAGLYRIFDYTPFSWNKMKAINHICNLYELPLSKKLEYYFPIIPFHSRFNELVPGDFKLEPNGYKGSVTAPKYLGYSMDLTKRYRYSDDLKKPLELVETALNDLLDYCDEEKIDITFVTVPQAKDLETLGKYNYINKLVSDRGYPVLDLMEKNDELGIDITKDFYNIKHTNIHGSLKFTRYMANYLIDTYGFEDKRGNEDYKDWDKKFEEYVEDIDHAVLDFEYDTSYDPSILAEPEELSAVAEKDNVTISYNAVEGADGYEIFERKGEKGKWTSIGTTDKVSFIDKDFEKKTEYTYRVVPYLIKNDKKAYGEFKYKGITVTAK